MLLGMINLYRFKESNAILSRSKSPFLFRLRQTDEKWMSIPAMAIKCRLYNLVPGSHRPKEETSRCMIEHLENVAVVAKINVRNFIKNL